MGYSLDFNGKVVAVTGASRGIGRAISLGFSSLGAEVILISRSREKLEETAGVIAASGGKAHVIAADLTDVDAINKTVDEIKTKYGKLDVLVNNAGVTKRMPSEEISVEDWERIMETNIKSYVFMNTAVFKKIMKEQGYGKIVSMASIGGKLGITRSLPYCASKGGVVSMTQVLGCEWAPFNIQVNAVGPAYIKTELISKAIENKEFLDTIMFRTPAKRLGEPEDVVGAVLFLASDLSGYISGHTLMVDGGLTAFAV